MADRKRTEQYMQKYSIQDLFDFIQSEIVYQQPENPRKFISELLGQINAGTKVFYSDDEIDILFSKFEVLERGFITKQQCMKALSDIGINSKIIGSLQLSEQIKKPEFQKLVKQSVEMRVNKWKGK